MTEAVATEKPNVEQIIEKYIALRDAVERRNNEVKAELEPMQAAMKGIETYLMALANETGQTQFGTKFGTAFVTTKTGLNIADRDLYWGWVQENPSERRHTLTLQANKTAIGEIIEKTGTPPPGLNWTVMKAIQIRRA